MVSDRHLSIIRERKKKIESNCIFEINLCKYCYKRNFGKRNHSVAKYFTNIYVQSESRGICFICKNFFQEKFPKIIDNIKSQLSEFTDYRPNIEIGTILNYQFYENEDYLRSMFQIRGKPNIKYEINSLIRKMIENHTGCKIDHVNPEVKFEIVVQDDLSYSINSINKEFYWLGRYRKFRRGISQKNRTKGENTANSVFDEKDYKCRNQSIESFIKDIMSQTYNINSLKISWTGGEDKNSLVMGKGRPFLMKSNSYCSIKNCKDIFTSNGIEIEFERIGHKGVVSIHRYKQLVRILLKLEKKIDDTNDLAEKVSGLVGDVRFRVKNKTVTRRIYEAKIISRRDNDVELLLNMDNGVPIKQFIGGKDPIEPCISEVLKIRCECIYFDIIEFT